MDKESTRLNWTHFALLIVGILIGGIVVGAIRGIQDQKAESQQEVFRYQLRQIEYMIDNRMEYPDVESWENDIKEIFREMQVTYLPRRSDGITSQGRERREAAPSNFTP